MKVVPLLAGTSTPTPAGRLTLSSVALVQHAEGPVLLDTAAWNQRKPLLDRLAACGLGPEGIRTVIVTHLHWDHCLNFELFSNATFLVPKGEWARLERGELDTATPFFIADVLRGWRMPELVEPGQLMSGVELFATPGHTSGHCSVLVEDERGPLVFAGDALPTRAAAEAGVPHLVFGEHAEAQKSVREILHLGRVVIPGHDIPLQVSEGKLEPIQEF